MEETLWEQKGARLPRWNELPDFELYLDQVLNLLDKYLFPFVPCEDPHIVTASMINNYVKLQLLPPPTKKKYNRSHLAHLIAIGVLKQTLSLPMIRILLDKGDPGNWYDPFCELLEQAFFKMNDCATRDGESALERATLACAAKVAAERLALAAVKENRVQG